ncbi:unnamed protein product [Fraxinus pennsylvanica]|uniref:Avr9/Cf-9 rapidly elicited protein 146 n=1 Tax=Fraxinus pennsylvanica TaxID=56036 RepID=A0AAD2DUZ6_9LAMI|nr:unnamed protein product [Fraxinus pennsylvanica]
MAELNVVFKRWKVAGKAIQNLMFHHTHHWSTTSSSSSSATPGRSSSPLDSPNESEFSCTNSPAHPNFHLPFHLKKRKPSNHLVTEEDLMTMTKTAEMFYSAEASPASSGFGKSHMVRQLRVTDSPFPLRGADEDNQVDKDAEEFIAKFYNNLKRQIEMATPRRGESQTQSHVPPLVLDHFRHSQPPCPPLLLHSLAAAAATRDGGGYSPFTLQDVDEDNHVDEAAEKFIMKFYNDLRRQI